MHKGNAAQAAWACAVLAVIAGISTIAVAGETKEIPDHAGFQSCEGCHDQQHSMWAASGHSKSISRVTNSPRATADCYGCHSAEGFAAKREGKKVDLAAKESLHSIGCLTCHDPRGAKYPDKLVMDRDELCESCHTQRAVLQGRGAKGIEDIRGVHSDVSCVSCHMSEGNHRMQVLRPDDPNLSATRLDTCTACHKDGNGKARAKELQEWQAEYQESMDKLQATLTAVNATLKDKPDLLNADLKAKLDTVKQNLFILQRDGSRSAHNPDFAIAVMAEASSDLNEVKAGVGR
jgi:predicted CXXCH cytochrome family protein